MPSPLIRPSATFSRREKDKGLRRVPPPVERCKLTANPLQVGIARPPRVDLPRQLLGSQPLVQRDRDSEACELPLTDLELVLLVERELILLDRLRELAIEQRRLRNLILLMRDIRNGLPWP